MNGTASGSFSGNRHNQGVEDDLYGKLWHACAGAVYVPSAGERVFYFPQGHLEQVAAFTQHLQDGDMEIPVYDLPSKILCRVIIVQLMAEPYTDEVFARVTLLPMCTRDELIPEDEAPYEIPQRTKSYCFSKILTASDTSTHGGFSIPKRHADACFPPLDMTRQPPMQEIVAKDLHGFEWHFKHIYRGHPKRHLLTGGWSMFVNSKKLVAGDTCIFASGENGEIRVGIRRATNQHSNISTSRSLISSHSLQLGVLTGASYALETESMFTVYYHPWTNPFEFMTPVETYMKSTEMDYSFGTRVQSRLCAVEESARRYAGTIIANEDIDHIRWPGSEWRCLKVHWDAIINIHTHPERVCSWWIEPLESWSNKRISILPRSQPNKARVLSLSLPGLSRFSIDDTVGNSAMTASHMQGTQYQSLGSSISVSHQDMSTSTSNMNSSLSESHGWPPYDSKDENDGRYQLFGVSLLDGNSELPSQQFVNSTSPMCVTSRKTCKKCHSVNSRSCTKVLKVGTPLGRAVDLAHFHGYDELISKLDQMFDFEGSLINGSSGWHVTCIDDDGDMMLLGDYPWQDFRSIVQKMIICPKDGTNIPNPSS